MAFDSKLLDVVACPVCKGKLILSQDKTQLLCRFDRLAYPVKDGIPVLMESEATQLTSEQLEESR